MRYEPVIGLEVHIQLKTASKMFAPEGSAETDAPNRHISPVSLGHPGTLPVPNKRAIEMAVRMATALGCTINTHSKFDRKNYFYPDLPKGYQISQFDLPVGSGGEIVIETPNAQGERNVIRIGIERLHLEEDAAKNIHPPSPEATDGQAPAPKTLVDYNRAGVPLIELVSKPDLRTSEEAKAYLQEVRLIARTLGVSDADMEKGHLRCDANISLRRLNDDGTIEGELFNPKTEIKNLNSFRMVERALRHEIDRQKKLWESHTPPLETTTRGWDDAKGVTVLQRVKEDSADYRYFPDPDLPRLDLTQMAEEAKRALPELPAQKRLRFKEEYKLSDEDVRMVVEDPELAGYTEDLFSELHAWLEARRPDLSEEEVEAKTSQMARLVGTWLLNKWVGVLSARKECVGERKISAENFAELMLILMEGGVTSANALKMLEVMTETGADPNHVMEERGFGKMKDEAQLASLVGKTLDAHPDEVKRYLAGEEKILKFLMGIVMKETEGRADPGLVQNLISVEIESRRQK